MTLKEFKEFEQVNILGKRMEESTATMMVMYLKEKLKESLRENIIKDLVLTMESVKIYKDHRTIEGNDYVIPISVEQEGFSFKILLEKDVFMNYHEMELSFTCYGTYGQSVIQQHCLEQMRELGPPYVNYTDNDRVEISLTIHFVDKELIELSEQ
jgi:hypothetical protein